MQLACIICVYELPIAAQSSLHKIQKYQNFHIVPIISLSAFHCQFRCLRDRATNEIKLSVEIDAVFLKSIRFRYICQQENIVSILNWRNNFFQSVPVAELVKFSSNRTFLEASSVFNLCTTIFPLRPHNTEMSGIFWLPCANCKSNVHARRMQLFTLPLQRNYWLSHSQRFEMPIQKMQQLTFSTFYSILVLVRSCSILILFF